MKKIVLCILCMLLAGSLLCGCSDVREYYIPTKNYVSGQGEVSQPVTEIELDWPSGSVQILTHEENTVTFREECTKSLSQEQQMQWAMEGSKLMIHYGSSDIRSFLNSAEKRLILTVPKNVELEALEIDVASAEVYSERIAAQRVEVDTASGDISLSLGNVQEAEFDSASGKIAVTMEQVNRMEAYSASGEMTFSVSSAERAELESASGGISFSIRESFTDLKAETSSGNIKLVLPENAGFTLKLDTASGEFQSELPLTVQGKSYVAGDGSARINLHTASGDVQILRA